MPTRRFARGSSSRGSAGSLLRHPAFLAPSSMGRSEMRKSRVDCGSQGGTIDVRVRFKPSSECCVGTCKAFLCKAKLIGA